MVDLSCSPQKESPMSEEPILTVIERIINNVKSPHALVDELITATLSLGLTPATIASLLQQLPGGIDANWDRGIVHQLAMQAERRFRDCQWQPTEVRLATREAQD